MATYYLLAVVCLTGSGSGSKIWIFRKSCSIFSFAFSSFLLFFPCTVTSEFLSNFVIEPEVAFHIRLSGRPTSRSVVFVQLHKWCAKYARAQDNL